MPTRFSTPSSSYKVQHSTVQSTVVRYLLGRGACRGTEPDPPPPLYPHTLSTALQTCAELQWRHNDGGVAYDSTGLRITQAYTPRGGGGDVLCTAKSKRKNKILVRFVLGKDAFAFDFAVPERQARAGSTQGNPAPPQKKKPRQHRLQK
eukprot:2612736-Rhodomonas_salina.1